jgi:hypothetical protein
VESTTGRAPYADRLARAAEVRLSTLQLDRLAKKFAGRYEEATSAPREKRGLAGVRDRRQRSAVQAGLAAQYPLASDNCVVAERCKRKTFRSPAADSRGRHDSERTLCAQRVGAEVPRSPRHPARMAAAGAETDSGRVKADPVRPVRQGHP